MKRLSKKQISKLTPGVDWVRVIDKSGEFSGTVNSVMAHSSNKVPFGIWVDCGGDKPIYFRLDKSEIFKIKTGKVCKIAQPIKEEEIVDKIDLPLDPEPFLIIRHGHIFERFAATDPYRAHATFTPRRWYEQDQSKYFSGFKPPKNKSQDYSSVQIDPELEEEQELIEGFAEENKKADSVAADKFALSIISEAVAEAKNTWGPYKDLPTEEQNAIDPGNYWHDSPDSGFLIQSDQITWNDFGDMSTYKGAGVIPVTRNSGGSYTAAKENDTVVGYSADLYRLKGTKNLDVKFFSFKKQQEAVEGRLIRTAALTYTEIKNLTPGTVVTAVFDSDKDSEPWEGTVVGVTQSSYGSTLTVTLNTEGKEPLSFTTANYDFYLKTPSEEKNGPKNPVLADSESPENSIHTSESSLTHEDFEYVLSNDADIPSLHRRSQRLLNDIRGNAQTLNSTTNTAEFRNVSSMLVWPITGGLVQGMSVEARYQILDELMDEWEKKND